VDRAQILAELARMVAIRGGEQSIMLRLCQASTEILQADGGAITLAYTEPQRVTLCFTDDTAERLEDLQDVLGEGPGPDAYRTGHAVVSEVTAERGDRWPMFVSAAQGALGGGSIYAFPMRPRSDVFGVLTFYQATTRPLGQDMEVAQFLADAVGAAIIREPDGHTDLSAEPWSTRAQVHQATGMVVAQLGVGVDDALALLRAHAYAHERKLTDIAKDVVDRRLDFSHSADRKGRETS
jgi:hypothetical protein